MQDVAEFPLKREETQFNIKIKQSFDAGAKKSIVEVEPTEDSFQEKFLCFLLFLPFSPTWEIFTQIANIWLILYAIFQVCFYDKFHFYFDVAIYYILEILFLINTALAYAHRYMTSINKFGLYPPRNIYLLLIDTASLLPIFELVYLVYPQHTEAIRNRVRLKVILRIVHFVFFVREKKRITSSNYTCIIIFIHTILILLMSMIASVIWSSLSCLGEPDCVDNWSESVKYIHVDTGDSLEWFTLCYTFMSITVMHNCTGFLADRTPVEAFYLILFMLIGFTIHIIVTTGQLIKITLQSLFLEHEYVNLLNQLYLILDSWLNINNETRDKVAKFYQVLWHKHGGVIREPHCLTLIPMALMKEVSIDIFWEMFRHSHTLETLDICVKKEISLKMKTEFYMKGDYILRKGINKYRIFYIVSGIVQVLSIQDDDSAILSFSGGTLLSEITILFMIQSTSNLRCATDVIIQSLSLHDLYTIFRNYTDVSRELRYILYDRIEYARDLDASRRARFDKGATVHKPIQRLKKQWRCISTLNRIVFGRKKQIFDYRLYQQIDYSFHSNCLDMLVLGDSLELQSTVICMTKSCPYVMHPASSFRAFWHYLHLLVVNLQCFMIPYNIVFGLESKWFVTYCFFFDVIYAIDLYVISITAIKTSSLDITNPVEIMLYNFKTMPFIIDIIATIPYDYILMSKLDSRQALLFKLNRTLKFYKIFMLLKNKQHDLKHNRLICILLKYILLYVIIIYYVTSLMTVVMCFEKECETKGINLNLTSTNTDREHVVAALAYSLSQLLDVGTSKRMPLSILEMIFYTIIVFIGMIIYSFFLCEVTCTIIKLCESTNIFRTQLRICAKLLITYMIPADLRSSALEYLTFNFVHGLVNDIEMLRESMPDELNQMLITTSLVNGLKQIPIFADLSEIVLKQLTVCAIFRTLSANTPLCFIGERPLYIHLIQKGYCEMICGMPGDVDKNLKYILKVGDSFPIIEALYNVDALNTIRTITAVEEICIDINKAIDIISNHQEEYVYIVKAIEDHFKKHEHLIKGNLKNLLPHKVVPRTSQTHKTKKKENVFTYDINDVDIIIGASEKMNHKILRYLMFKMTIHPRHSFNVIWEIFRSVVAVVYFLHYMLVDTILLDYEDINVYSFCAAKIVGIFDIFNRLHIQYYNEKGILITHPKKTSAYYIKRSFFLDVIGLLPLYELHLYRIYWSAFYSILLNTFLNAIFFSAILYRPFLGLRYVEWNGKGFTHDAAHMLKFILIFMAICLILANNLMLNTCERYLSGYMCSDFNLKKWGSVEPIILNNNDLFFMGIFSVTTKFSASFTSIPKTGTFFGIIEIFIVIVFLWICKILITATITAEALGGSMQIIKYRNNMKNFLSFIKKEMVSEETILDFTEHFEFLWKKCEGIFLSDLFKTINEKLRLDISFHLYEDSLTNSPFFQNVPKTDIRLFIKHMVIHYFKRDAQIIRCNDIQDIMFFISKGEIDIYIADCHITTLKPGGTFGCFSRNDYTRQTITAVAKIHVELLAIRGCKFYKLATKYPVILSRINMSIAAGDEFCETEGFDFQNMSLRHQIRVNSSKFEKTYNAIFYKINEFINIDSVYYKWYIYILHVHFAPLSCIALLFVQFTESSYVYVQMYVCLSDLVFYVHIFLNFHLYYVDAESGIKVVDPSKIQKRYMKSFMCWLDIFGSLPLELLTFACGVTTRYLYYAMANRLIRFFHMMDYYEAAKRTLGLNTFLQCAYIFYMIIFQMSVTSLVWFLATCGELPCPYTTMDGDTLTVKFFHTKVHKTVRSFLYTANMFSYSNAPSMHPSTYTEVLVSICIQIASVLIVALVFGAITSLIIINAVNENKYICDMDQMNSYLTNRNLSIFLIKKVQTYFRALWVKRRGEFLPSLIMEAPSYLKQNLMVAMYSHHLCNHELFKNTHIDFIRQICCYFQLRLYVSEQVIVEKGEVDLCMYFIHRGEVSQIRDNGRETTTLFKGSAFGERQGLYRVPHQFTFVAHTTVDILILNKVDWKHILKWFPASKEIIYATLAVIDPPESVSISSGTFMSDEGGSHFSFGSTNYFED